MDVHTTEGAVVDSVEDILADLDMSGVGSDSADEVIETLDSSDIEAVATVEAIEEAYEEQETSTADVADVASEAEPTAKPKRAKKAAGEKKERAPRDLASLPEDVFVLSDGITDLAANKATVIGSIPKQKKIAEKFENVFRSVAAGKAPSEFVKIAFNVVKAGSAKSTDIVSAMKAADYSEGTARSQAGQMMALFPVLGVASRVGQELTFNADAPMSKRLAALI